MPLPIRSIWEPRVTEAHRDGLLDFIYSRCTPIPECGCMLWEGWNDGSKGEFGEPFGKLQVAGLPLFVHRTTWELVFGRPVGWNKLLDHKCRIRICCNPYHLEEVTPKTNTHRGKGVWYGKV